MMERIDHGNYEAWLLDRLEGNLTPGQERMLDAFLAANPGLDPGPTDLPSLDPERSVLSAYDKEALKRSLPPAGMPHEPLDDFLIARLEGDLTPQQEEALRLYLLAHPEHQRAERTYALTKLVPAALAFAEKRSLERELPPVGMPTPALLEDFLVARLEGDLNAEQAAALDELLVRDANARVAWELFRMTKVSAEGVTYSAKEDLKKGGKVVPITRWAGASTWSVRLRAAAAIALVCTVGVWLLSDSVEDNGLAVVEMPVQQNGTSQPEQQAGVVSSDPGEQAPSADVDTAAPEEADRIAPRGLPSSKGPHQRGTDHPSEHGGQQPARSTPQPRADTPMLAEVRGTLPMGPLPEALPIAGSVEPGFQLPSEAPETFAQVERSVGIPLMTYLSGKLRKRMLGEPGEEARPLGPDDALAALDKGLRQVAGEEAGLSVERAPEGRITRFDLRLGRNLAISANR